MNLKFGASEIKLVEEETAGRLRLSRTHRVRGKANNRSKRCVLRLDLGGAVPIALAK